MLTHYRSCTFALTCTLTSTCTLMPKAWHLLRATCETCHVFGLPQFAAHTSITATNTSMPESQHLLSICHHCSVCSAMSISPLDWIRDRNNSSLAFRLPVLVGKCPFHKVHINSETPGDSRKHVYTLARCLGCCMCRCCQHCLFIGMFHLCNTHQSRCNSTVWTSPAMNPWSRRCDL